MVASVITAVCVVRRRSQDSPCHLCAGRGLDWEPCEEPWAEPETHPINNRLDGTQHRFPPGGLNVIRLALSRVSA